MVRKLVAGSEARSPDAVGGEGGIKEVRTEGAVGDDGESFGGEDLAEAGGSVELGSGGEALQQFRVIVVDVVIRFCGCGCVVAVIDETASGLEVTGFPASLHVAFINGGFKESRAGGKGSDKSIAEPKFGHFVVGGVEVAGAHGAGLRRSQLAGVQPMRAVRDLSRL